jgi:hypothetical protein
MASILRLFAKQHNLYFSPLPSLACSHNHFLSCSRTSSLGGITVNLSYGSDHRTQYICDMIADGAEDWRQAYVRLVYGPKEDFVRPPCGCDSVPQDDLMLFAGNAEAQVPCGRFEEVPGNVRDAAEARQRRLCVLCWRAGAATHIHSRMHAQSHALQRLQAQELDWNRHNSISDTLCVAQLTFGDLLVWEMLDLTLRLDPAALQPYPLLAAFHSRVAERPRYSTAIFCRMFCVLIISVLSLSLCVCVCQCVLRRSFRSHNYRIKAYLASGRRPVQANNSQLG